MMNNDCQEYDFGIESLFLRCNKTFHFCSKDTHIMFLPSNLLNKRHVDLNLTFQVIGLFQSCLVSLILTPFAITKWSTQIFFDWNRFNKGE